MINIIKANNLKDGGYYIDQYLAQVLSNNGLPTQKILLSQGTDTLDYDIVLKVNYKNPLKAIPRLAAHLRKNKVSQTYTNQFIVLFYLAIIRIFFRGKFRIIAKVDGRTIRRGWKKYTSWLYDLLWKWAQHNADFVIYETQIASNYWKKKNSTVIHTPAVNYFGIDLENFDFKKPSQFNNQEKPVVLYVGRYSEEKGYDRIADLASVFPDILFVTIGGDHQAFANLSNVIEIGQLPITQILNFYMFSDALIVPSRDDSFPSVIREYLWFNKPIFSQDVGAIREFKELGANISLYHNNTDIQLYKINYNETSVLKNNKQVYDLKFNPDSEHVHRMYVAVFQDTSEISTST